jgi:uncharacterized membrane protein
MNNAGTLHYTGKHRQIAGLKTRAFTGACIGAAVAFIVLSFGDVTRDFGRWMLFPFIIACIAGAVGGSAFVLTDSLRRKGGWRRTLANVLSGFFYCVVLSAALFSALKRPD